MQEQNWQMRPVAAVAEVALVVELAERIWTEHYTKLLPSGQVPYMLQHFQSATAITRQLQEGVCYYLAFIGDDAVGYIAVQPQATELFISKLYVLQSHRGMGIGKAMLHHVSALHVSSALRLTVNKGNALALAAYKAWGFTLIDDVRVDIGGDYVMDDYVLRKLLT